MQSQKKEVLDVEVYTALLFAHIPFLRNIGPTKESRKNVKKALAKKSDPISLTYTNSIAAEIQASIEKVHDAQRVLSNFEEHTVKQIYQSEIHNYLTRRSMLDAALNANDELFFPGARKIYGTPSAALIEFTSSRVQQLVKSGKRSSSASVQEAAERCSFCVPETSQESLRSFFDTAGIPNKKETTNERVWKTQDFYDAFSQEMKKRDIHGWTISIEDAANFAVRGHEKEIVVPSDARLHDGRLVPVRDTHARALVAHEMVHVQRAHNGMRSQLMLLGSGFPHYLPGEEGIAWWEQAKIEGANDLPKFEHRVATMLCLGLFDGKKRNLYEVYPLLIDVLALMHAEESTAASEEDIQKQAWKVCVRVFRGTTGLTPGACFTKDAVAYADGFLQVVRAVQANPNLEQYLYAGKYDPANEQHVAWLRELNIIH